MHYTLKARNVVIGDFADVRDAVSDGKARAGREWADYVVWFGREVRCVIQAGGDAIMVTPAGWAVVADDCLDLDALESAIAENP